MKKTLTILAISGLLLIIMAASVFAYSEATGCIIDGATSLPWTHGGYAEVYNNGSGTPIGGQFPLDGNGCFLAEIHASGTHNAGEVRITLNPGPEGTPDPIACTYEAQLQNPVILDCGDMPTNTGPNAVTWSNVSADASAGFPVEAAAFGLLALILVSGGIALLRQQRQTF